MDLTNRIRSNLFIIAFSLLILIVAAVTVQSVLLEKEPEPDTGIAYTYYNNFLIFRGSINHLMDHQNLYQHYPEEYYDLYKYSPTFAVMMAPFELLPVKVGLFLWNLLNALVLFFAVWKFPSWSPKQKLLALLFIVIELITSLQNHQSNALIAGLIILSFIFFEKNNRWVATLLIAITVFIKIFGLMALLIMIFYPKKIKSGLIYLFWMVVLGILPLVLVSPSELWQQYHNWFDLLMADQTVYYGISVMGWLQSWFGLNISKYVVAGIGAFLLLLPLIKYRLWLKLDFKVLFLSSLLLWMVIFNHMAESPTYIISVSGVAIWFFSREKLRWENIVLLLLVLGFTILSPTDIFPPSLRDNLVAPYVLKAVPCILVWAKIQYELIKVKVGE